MEEEVNAFLRGHRVLQVERHFCADNGGYWAIMVEYADYAPFSAPATRKEKRDYAKELDDESRERFEQYRVIRRNVAQSNNVAAYMVFTDAELAALARLPELTMDAARKEKSVHASRLETYLKFFIPTDESETGGQPAGADSQH